MTPNQARGAPPGTAATEDERVKYREQIYARVRENTRKHGEQNMNRCKKEVRRSLPPVNIGDLVLVAAKHKRKKHGVDRGCVLNSFVFLTHGNLVDIGGWRWPKSSL